MLQIDPQAHERKTLYKLLTGLILPRPIAWVSTLSAEGVANLAPFSYFTIAAVSPPTLLFCPANHPDGSAKDTLRNLDACPEFVVHCVSEELAAAMNQTAAPYPPAISEFAAAGLTMAPSSLVRPPRVAEAKAAFECRLTERLAVGDGNVVLGEVVAIHVSEAVYVDGYIDLDALAPIGRLVGDGYVRATDRFAIGRPQG